VPSPSCLVRHVLRSRFLCKSVIRGLWPPITFRWLPMSGNCSKPPISPSGQGQRSRCSDATAGGNSLLALLCRSVRNQPLPTHLKVVGDLKISAGLRVVLVPQEARAEGTGTVTAYLDRESSAPGLVWRAYTLRTEMPHRCLKSTGARLDPPTSRRTAHSNAKLVSGLGAYSGTPSDRYSTYAGSNRGAYSTGRPERSTGTSSGPGPGVEWVDPWETST
jgi:hypothetical protein